MFYIFLGILGTILGLISSVFSKHLIDAVTGHDSENIGFIISTIIGMGLGSIVLEAVTGRISAKINIKVGNEIKVDIFVRRRYGRCYWNNKRKRIPGCY